MSAPTPSSWGRIDDEGTVFVRTGEGERPVGQWPGGDATEAMAFYTRRFDGLAVEVNLLERRIAAGTLSPDEAAQAVRTVRGAVAGANAVGDLDGLAARVDALEPAIAAQRDARRVARAKEAAAARTRKTAIAERAEKVAQGENWRSGADQLRAMLDEWKALPRLERSVDDALWHRFSGARTTYTRRRKAHFAEQGEQRGRAQTVKEKLVTEAEALSESNDWGPTAGAYRDLMSRWKAAGPAPRGVDDALWRRFRAAQDAFFGARDAANAKVDAEYEANADVKRAILVDAEALLPVTDVDAARAAWRGIADRWEEAGKVPRAAMQELEARIRKVEDAIRDAGETQWRRTNPEGRARADDTIAKLERSLTDLRADLERASSNGDERTAAQLRESVQAREAWLDQARQVLADFS